MPDLTFTKIRAGFYATPDGRYAAQRDVTGYVTIEDREGSGVRAGCDDDGWSLSFDRDGRLRSDQDAGELLDWFETKRAAIAFAQWHSKRNA